ncbi:MAG TPA: serine/threonine-protein kinase [Gemmata sp.]|nr:serine/threonine-protein kinase [Gemmata sp.]
MPEPLPAAPEREPHRDHGSTAGWDAADPAISPAANDTVTRTIGSTPGPADPHRPTREDDTERIRPNLEPDGTPSAPEIPGYRVEKMIGKGGMGVVYLARDLTLNRVVALKVMHPGGRDHSHISGRFDREVKALAAIEHPNIVRIYHGGEWHGFPYFTMQFVPNGPLSQHVERFHADRLGSVRLVAKVARAVQALHDNKVIHRDLKPLNILLGEDDEPLVADFGLAKWLEDDADSEFSLTGLPIGTRYYMSPEQTLGKRSEYSGACDVWALGVILYELLANRRPFLEDGKSNIFKRIREEPAPSLPEELPRELAAIVEKCLAKNPADRYATAAALADDLEAWLEGRPISLPAQRRTKYWLLVAALAGLALIVAVPVSLVAFSRTPREQRETIADELRAGKTIVFIGPRGKAIRPIAQVPGCDQFFQVDEKGYARLTSLKAGAVELYNGPIPVPVLFVADIAVAETSVADIVPGLYVGRKETLASDGFHQSAVLATRRDTISRERGKEGAKLTEYALTLANWRQLALGERDGLDAVQLPRRPRVPNEVYQWHTCQILIDPRQIACTWQGVRTLKTTEADVASRLDLVANIVNADKPGLGLCYTKPVLGTGLGLLSVSGGTVFRNVKLIPQVRTP